MPADAPHSVPLGDGNTAPGAAAPEARRWRLPPRSLAARLILGTTVLVVVGHIASTYLVLGMIERSWLREQVVSVDQLSTSITTATRHLMRAERKDDAYALMQTIGEAQGVARIRIYSRTGRVAFRTDAGTEASVGRDAPPCQVCHATDPPRERAPAIDRARFTQSPGRGRELALVTPIGNEPGCSTAQCHSQEGTARVLGVLDLAVGLDAMDDRLRSLRAPAFLVTTLAILLVVGFLNFVIHRTVSRPLHRLVVGTRAVAHLDLSGRVPVEAAGELRELAAAFNLMQERLLSAKAENERTLADLEDRVERRSQELQAARQSLVESDRLASLGKLAASVAHEVNNPISAVLNLSMFLQRILTDDGVPPGRLADFRRHLQQISDETARAGRIVKDLLAFSRRSAPLRAPADLNAVVQKAVDLVRHRGEIARVDLAARLDPRIPPVPCDADQIVQVVVNLLVNAVEALKEGGHIVVRTGVEAATDSAVVQVEDDGPGIPRDIVARIFDPFFSTKTAAKGVGLGLSVSYGIVEAHGGRLTVHSESGKQTVFTARLPLHPGQRPAEA